MLLDAAELRPRLVDDGPYAALDLVTVTGSTNTDLVAAASRGAADRTVLIAEEQNAGRGRMDRSWVSPRAFGLHVSVLLRPELPPAALTRLPLVAGIAVAETIVAACALPVSLKWPNDVLLGTGEQRRKTAGILAEATAGPHSTAVVVGMGLNVHHGPDDLPPRADGVPATSLAAEGSDVDRTELVVALLDEFARLERVWRSHAGDLVEPGLLDSYRAWCGTLGQRVRADLGDSPVHGTAIDVDDNGGLLLRTGDGAVVTV